MSAGAPAAICRASVELAAGTMRMCVPVSDWKASAISDATSVKLAAT